MTSLTTRSRAAAIALCLVAVPLASCSSSKAKDSAVAVETTAAMAAETAAAAAAETEAMAAETTAAAAAETEAMAADSAAAGASDPMAAVFAGMGITDPKQLECAKAEMGTDMTNQSKMVKGLMKCAPDVIVQQSLTGFKEKVPEATDEQAKCVILASFKVISDVPDDQMTKVMSNDIPQDLKDKMIDAGKDCGLTKEQIAKSY